MFSLLQEVDDEERNARNEERRAKEKQERMETSLREREKEVQKTLSSSLRERDKEREQHKKEEAVQHFKVYLCFVFDDTVHTYEIVVLKFS